MKPASSRWCAHRTTRTRELYTSGPGCSSSEAADDAAAAAAAAVEAATAAAGVAAEAEAEAWAEAGASAGAEEGSGERPEEGGSCEVERVVRGPRGSQSSSEEIGVEAGHRTHTPQASFAAASHAPSGVAA